MSKNYTNINVDYESNPFVGYDSILHLPLIPKWFFLTKAGTKAADYRALTPYWFCRLALYNGFSMSQKKWLLLINTYGIDYILKMCHPNFCDNIITFKHYNINRLTLGYPKSSDKARIIDLQHKGISIGYGNPDWGAVPDTLYFVIHHGIMYQF